MYGVDPVLNNSPQITHTENMYKLDPIFAVNSSASTSNNQNDLDKFLPKTSCPKSKLGQKLESTKSDSCKQGTNQVKVEHQVVVKSSAHAEPVNEMLLDKYIVRKRAPISKLGKQLQGSKETENPALVHRLMELSKMIDAYLTPMSLGKLVSSSISKSMAKSTYVKNQHKSDDGPKKSENLGIFTPAVELEPQSSQGLTDIAVHCDPSCPPFALLAYSQMLLFSGRNVSVQFYRHSSLTSVPNYLTPLEHFFTGKPRSSTCDFILSVIWRPSKLGCMLIENPFTDNELYGEPIILMSLSRFSPDFEKVFRNISLIETALKCSDEKSLIDCANKIARKGDEMLSLDEIYLFLSSASSRRSSVLQKSAKAWFDRCKRNSSLDGALKVIELCH